MHEEVAAVAIVEVFDPAMCCSTGVCGPSVDPALSTFAADLTWLGGQGVAVVRHNLSQEPGSFVENPVIQELLAREGEGALPAVVVGGELLSFGRYPTRDELVTWSLRALSGQSQGDAASVEPSAVTTPTDTACCGGEDATLVSMGTESAGPSGSGCCG
ncbi:arsenite efflux transporter metallochaperone ArsD [Ferrimicrobium sp.]|uniref:arsenite efflux transporter metallochaperone ArsD n=1 Tax=Ferrimicrobium sp. TaxID=2926050 RepID=UPI0026244F7B|nr:arsenite efflux transporter metallochaperone ArsD [Ferrimicrobium sp.]